MILYIFKIQVKYNVGVMYMWINCQNIVQMASFFCWTSMSLRHHFGMSLRHHAFNMMMTILIYVLASYQWWLYWHMLGPICDIDFLKIQLGTVHCKHFSNLSQSDVHFMSLRHHEVFKLNHGISHNCFLSGILYFVVQMYTQIGTKLA